MRRGALPVLLLLALALFWFFRPRGPTAPALPPPYDRLDAALGARDRTALASLARVPGYAAIPAHRALAEDAGLSRKARLDHLEAVLAFEGRRADRWAAALLLGLGEAERALELARMHPGEPWAEAIFRDLAENGHGAAVRALLSARRYREALRYAKTPEDRGRALLGLGRYREALDLLRDPEERARALLALGRYREAERLFAAAGYLLGVGEARLREGRSEAAVRAFLQAGERGLWRAAGALEARDPRRALAIYLRLAAHPSPLGEDAAYRAYRLAAQLGEPEGKARAYRLLRGGLAALAGKPLGKLRLAPLPAQAPPGFTLVRALWRRGRGDWARGEARYRARASSGETRRAWAWVLYRLGEVREAARYGGLRLRYPTPWRAAVFAEANRRGLDPWLLFAVIRVESAFDPGAVSPTGAKGLLQFTAATWREVAERLGEAPADPFDPVAAIRYGAFYLGDLLRRFGDVRLALMAYNGGPGYVARGLARYRDFDTFWRFGAREEPRRYLAKVAEAWAIYRALARVSRKGPGFLAGLPAPP